MVTDETADPAVVAEIEACGVTVEIRPAEQKSMSSRLLATRVDRFTFLVLGRYMCSAQGSAEEG